MASVKETPKFVCTSERIARYSVVKKQKKKLKHTYTFRSLPRRFRIAFNLSRLIAARNPQGLFPRVFPPASVVSRTLAIYYFLCMRYRYSTAVPRFSRVTVSNRVRSIDQASNAFVVLTTAHRSQSYTSLGRGIRTHNAAVCTLRASITRNSRLYLIYCRVPIFASARNVPKLLY